MPHPFFDVTAYPWHRDDAKAAHRALYDTIQPPTRIDVLYKQSGSQLIPLALGKPPDEIWKDVLELLTTARCLQKLCEIILHQSAYEAAHPHIQALVDAQDVLQQPLLTGDLLFIDRTPLRGELAKLATGNPAVRTLLVRGGDDSGKSWTNYMVKDLAQVAGEDCLYLFEGLVSTVKDVLAELFAAVVGDSKSVPDRLQTEDAWFQRACVELQEAAKKQNKVFWIVVDDLGISADGPRLDPLIRRFFDQFALRMGNPVFAKWFRLVLIDYPDGQVPTKWLQGCWVEDRPAEADMNEEAVAQFLLQWAQRKQKLLAPAKARELAQGILAKVMAPPSPADTGKPRLQRIHDAVVVSLQSL
jgi:hypothetical protein